MRLRQVPHELKFVQIVFFWNTCLKASFSSTFGWKHLITSYCQHYNAKELNSFQNKSFEQLCKFSQLILPTNTTSGINEGNAKRGVSPRLKIRPWPLTSIGFQILLRCTKFGQNPLKDVDSRVFTRMLCSKNLTRWHWPLTLKINRVPDSPKD